MFVYCKNITLATKMNIENPRKYSLQLATFNVVKKYAEENDISILYNWLQFACRKINNNILFINLFQLFQKPIMNHPKSFVTQSISGFICFNKNRGC